MSSLIKDYVNELGTCLKKESVEELRKFVDSHSMYFNPATVERFKNAPDTVVEITLYKMIYARTDMPRKLKIKAKTWLQQRGYNLDIF